MLPFRFQLVDGLPVSDQLASAWRDLIRQSFLLGLTAEETLAALRRDPRLASVLIDKT